MDHKLQKFLDLYQKSIEDPALFWKERSLDYQWFRQGTQVLNWEFHTPSVKWFEDWQLNITVNCLDRHLPAYGDRTAFFWEPNEPGQEARTLSYRDLYERVNKLGNAFRSLGIRKGDRICIYMPMIPEAVVAMLACARIGAVHSVVFGGFSANSLADRIKDSSARLVVTADGVRRGSKLINLKEIVDTAVSKNPSVKHVIVYEHLQSYTPKSNEHTWSELTDPMPAECEPEIMNAEDPLFILYTSGSTGKPKGVLHTCGGYMIHTGYTHKLVFDYRPEDIYWCTADIGWITGHSYIVYGPLLNAASSVLFEGIPSYPDPGRFWSVIDKYKVSIFYTAPTAIRALEKEGEQWPQKYSLRSLRILGTVGEPINVEAWEWYQRYIGKGNCPIVDTWWQTETGGILISPVPDVTPLKPGFATLPLPGIQPCLLNDEGQEKRGNPAAGNLCLKFPWPGMARTVFGDHERFRSTYFSRFPGYYFTGDGARRDEEGYYRITGRVDDVIIVSGHNLGTAEIESALDEHPLVVESAVVGYPHPVKNQGIHAFLILNSEDYRDESLRKELVQLVSEKIGPLAKPDRLQVVPGLPKTRSGKIMRRILRKIAEGERSDFGDTSTLLDPAIVDAISAGDLLS